MIIRDYFRIDFKLQPDKVHLDAAMDWLSQSQKVTNCGGSSAAYIFSLGWAPPYPETTGYIIPTFLNYSMMFGENKYFEKAKSMGDWEIEIQLDSGAVRGGIGINDYPIVFNTGQVILGWIALYENTKSEKYLKSAIRAADWLVDIQEDNGAWSKFVHGGIAHPYHTRVAWSILEVYKCKKDEKYLKSAKQNVLYVLKLFDENGWIDVMRFDKNKKSLSHGIAYTLRGLLECSQYFKEDLKEQILKIVNKASEKIMHKYELSKKNPNAMPSDLPATFDSHWNSKSTYSCLTGNAQIAIVWLKLYKFNNDARFLNAALKMIDQLKMKQNLNSSNKGIKGGIAGSFPIWGEYMKFSYPNYAAKFFVDALMLQEKIMDSLTKDKK